MKTKRAFVPRTIDRSVFAILAVLHMASAVYLIGPFYLEVDVQGARAPLMTLFNSSLAVTTYGWALLINGLALLYASAGKRGTKFVSYTAITSGVLLSGFLLRLYSLIGVILALESWRPPQYLSHAATVLILGSYWVYVKVMSREGTSR
jgi:hypothetical protein